MIGGLLYTTVGTRRGASAIDGATRKTICFAGWTKVRAEFLLNWAGCKLVWRCPGLGAGGIVGNDPSSKEDVPATFAQLAV